MQFSNVVDQPAPLPRFAPSPRRLTPSPARPLPRPLPHPLPPALLRPVARAEREAAVVTIARTATGAVMTQSVPAGAAGGGTLRDARRARGRTIADMAHETRIPARMLRAIEAGDFADPRSRPGAVAFAATYARRLGLDADAVAAAVRGALSRLPGRPYVPISGIEDDHDRAIAAIVAVPLFCVALLMGAGWCAWMLL